MTVLKYIFRSLIYHRRNHFRVIMGTMVSTTIIVGALITGDSIRYSLNRIVNERLGNTRFALNSGDRFFNAQTAMELSDNLKIPAAPLLQTKGIAVVEGGSRRINNIQVIGVDDRFGSMGNIPDFFDNLSPEEAVINSQIAERLNLKIGDEFLLRIDNLNQLPGDVPLALDSEESIAHRFTVRSIASKNEFGGFNLRADQITPFNVFVHLDFLGREMELENRSNIILVADDLVDPISVDSVNDAFKEVWSLTDAGLRLTPVSGNDRIEIKSERIFLDEHFVNSVLAEYDNSQQIFTYIINEFRHKEKTTPYSFITGLNDRDLAEDEIIINEWLAADLGAKVGDPITLTYYILGSSRSLKETTAEFRVKSVVSIKGDYADRNLLPDFPGFVEAENCRDWDPGIPIDLNKIREKDEDYWDKYRGTPKAFISLISAQELWKNRFGSLTALRIQGEDITGIKENLENIIDPGKFGFLFRDVKNEGFSASSQSVDFAQLFLGLSFFIIISALLLTGLLYAFNIEQRTEETGSLLAMGFTKRTVKYIIFLEGIILVVIGSILGAVSGILYNQIVLIALRTVWQDIVGTSSLQIHVDLSTVFTGITIGIIITLITIRLVLRNQLKQSIVSLQKGTTKLETIKNRKPTLSLIIGLLCFMGVISILILIDTGRGREAFLYFFIAGSLLLTGGIALINVWIIKKARNITYTKVNIKNIGMRNTVRRRFRSLALAGLLASGLFIVFTVGANRQNSLTDAEKRESGTGGFAMIGESMLPILYDLNSEKGRNFYSLNEIDPEKVRFILFRVKEGDDASCLNLNRVSNPQIIGIDPNEFIIRKPFSFIETIPEVDPDNPWEILSQDLPDNVIPGIADHSVIVWGMGKSVGDIIEYISESGEIFKVKLVGGLANSIFQGNIIISEKAFLDKYPSTTGSNIFLVDTPISESEDIYQKINWALQDQGVDLTHSSDKLAQFNKVENTYLSIFLLLGTFGLILGSIGIGIVISKNVKERKSEFALLRAVGFKRDKIQLLILTEHFFLFFAGVFLGIITALLATIPSLMTPGSNIPYTTLILLLVLVVINGVFWVFSASNSAAKRDLLPALRNE
ncbi:FtsX-like permease family protein [candidate division KSB1 bacterium]